MRKVLANDGLSVEGERILRDAGHTIHLGKIAKENLIQEINRIKYDAIIVRSATPVTRELIDNCPSIKVIGRAGVGMDFIDMEYAIEKGIEIINTPEASAPAVAEMVFAHLLSLSRHLFIANRKLPLGGNFEELKKECSCGTELSGKTIGILGFGRVGQEVAKRAFGLGMNVIAHDPYVQEANIKFDIPGVCSVIVNINTLPLNDVLAKSDIISIHIPLVYGKNPFITKNEISKMKDGVIVINVSKSGVICEDDLIEELTSGKIKFAGLDTFVGEPNPRPELLSLKNVSVSPHIGGETLEAQSRIGIDIANRIVEYFNKIDNL